MSIGLYLLEDEEWLRKGLKKLIPWQKLDLVLMGETGSGSTAVMELLDKKPDLFLCDIRVPGETGLSVIRKVRPYLPEMKCILISGYQDFSYAREAIDLNVLTYLLKPVKEEELTKALSNAVDLIAKEQKHRYSQRLARNTILVNALEHPLSPEQTCDNSPVLPGPASYCVAVFYVSGGCTYQIFSDLTEHIRQILAFSGLHCDLYQKSSSEYGIIFSSVHSLFLTEQAAGFIRELDLALSRMGEHYSCLGSTVHKLSDIPVSYNTAKMAYLYRDVHAASHVAFYQEDMIKSLRLPPPSLLEEFHLALGSGDTVQINNLLESMFEQLRSTQGITIQECMDSLSYLCFDIIRLLHQKGIRSRNYYDKCYKLLEVRESCHTFSQLEDWARDFFMEAAQDIRGVRQKAADSAVERVKEYIDTHYRENITLNGCAGMVNLNPAYLSTLFRKITDHTFSDYIALTRMQKASILLSRTALSVSEIAGMAGYENVRYFSKLFRRYYGMTPTEYREKAGVDENEA